MKVTAFALRQDIYRLLDRVLETGRPVEIARKGKTLRIIAEEPPRKLEQLGERPYLRTDPEALVELDWSGEWRP